MHVALQGRLEHFGARTLLVFIAANAHEGTFDAQSGGDHARLALRDGQVVAGEAMGATDPIDVVAKLLQWSEGMFTFLDEVVLPEGAVPVGMEMAALIAAADERIEDARRIVELFPDDNIRFRVVNRPPGEINMTAEEFQILFQIGNGKSLAQLKNESGRTAADLYPIIKRLQMTGLVETAGDPDATAKDAHKAPASPPAASRDQAPAVAPVPSAAPPPLAPLPGTVLARAFVSDAGKTPQTSHPVESKPSPEPRPVEQPSPAAAAPAPEPAAHPTPAPAAAAPAQEKPASGGGPTLSSAEAPLVGTLTADDGTMHPLLEETSTIGRTAANAIALRDPSVSAKHARVTRSAEGFTIEDIGSRNGTFVNSEKLTDKRLLVEGDLVRLGKIILTFNLASDVKRKQSTEREMIK